MNMKSAYLTYSEHISINQVAFTPASTTTSTRSTVVSACISQQHAFPTRHPQVPRLTANNDLRFGEQAVDPPPCAANPSPTADFSLICLPNPQSAVANLPVLHLPTALPPTPFLRQRPRAPQSLHPTRQFTPYLAAARQVMAQLHRSHRCQPCEIVLS